MVPRTVPLEMSPIDTRAFLDCPAHQRRASREVRQECERAAGNMEAVGLVVLEPLAAPDELEDSYLETCIEYFGQDEAALADDYRPKLQWQVGGTPPNSEVARSYPELADFLASMDPGVRPAMADGDKKKADPKRRFFAQFGPQPEHTEFPQLNAPPVIPAAFPQWQELTTAWGYHVLDNGKVLLSMCELAYDLEDGVLSSDLDCGPHLVAPTGIDLTTLEPGAEVAWAHLDLNHLSGHGRSNLPGLVAWMNSGVAVQVKLKPGQLLYQAGMQLAWRTNDQIQAGLHAVYAWPTLSEEMDAARLMRTKLVRSTSTVFLHGASDKELAPHPRFVTATRPARYGRTKFGHQVKGELDKIFGTVEELASR